MKIVIELLGPYSAWTRDRAGLVGLVHDLTVTRAPRLREPLAAYSERQLTIVISLDQAEAANPHQSGSEISA